MSGNETMIRAIAGDRLAALEAERDRLAAELEAAVSRAQRLERNLVAAYESEAVAHADSAQARADAERLQKGIAAVSNLIAESRGVCGLYLNGDDAPWEDLLTGGRFEEWLVDFDAARATDSAGARHDAAV